MTEWTAHHPGTIVDIKHALARIRTPLHYPLTTNASGIYRNNITVEFYIFPHTIQVLSNMLETQSSGGVTADIGYPTQ